MAHRVDKLEMMTRMTLARTCHQLKVMGIHESGFDTTTTYFVNSSANSILFGVQDIILLTLMVWALVVLQVASQNTRAILNF